MKLTIIREMKPFRKDTKQLVELYRWGTEKHVLISTIEEALPRLDIDPQVVDLIERVLPVKEVVEEETIAVLANRDGKVSRWLPIALVEGSGSREKVVRYLRNRKS